MLVVWRVGPKLNQNGAVKKNGRIYILPIDDKTGDFSLITGFEIDNANPVPQHSVINGPEWANSQRGWEVFYSCYSENFKTVRLCRLHRHQATWHVQALPSSDKKGMRTPSKNPLDAAPYLYYQNYEGKITEGSHLTKGLFGWRQDTDEKPIDVDLPSDIGQGKWMPDGKAIVHIRTTLNQQDGKFNKQLAIYDRLTGQDSLIFTDGRERRDPFPWNAPELNGQTAIVAIVQNLQTDAWDVEVYQQNEQGDWTIWNIISPIHKDFRVNYSPEAFVFQGRSYVSVVSYLGSDLNGWRNQPSIVWIASIDPKLQGSEVVRRIVSEEQDTSHISRKTDPESLIIQDGNAARIYYVDFSSANEKPKLMNCNSGLTPPN